MPGVLCAKCLAYFIQNNIGLVLLLAPPPINKCGGHGDALPGPPEGKLVLPEREGCQQRAFSSQPLVQCHVYSELFT